MPSDDDRDTCGICGEPIDGSFEWAARYRQAAGHDPAGPIETTYGPTLKAHTGCVSANRAVYVSRALPHEAGAS